MKTARKPAADNRMRELSEKELNEITRAVGDHVRAQSSEQKERLKESLRKELSSVRDAFARHGK